MDSCGHFEALANQCVVFCVLMMLGTKKPGITTPWFPVFYILHPDKGISSHIMGDVVLRRKLPHPMFRELSWLMNCKGLEVHLYSPPETLPVLQNAASRLRVVWNRTEMSSQLNFEQAEEGNWRRAILKSEDLAMRVAQKWLAPGAGGALEGVLTQSTQSGKIWL
jgi:hypothetical protein